MASLDDLKKRIASVKSTQKITKAMKMVAAAKLRRAQERAEALEKYGSEGSGKNLPFSSLSDDLKKNEIKKTKEMNSLLTKFNATHSLLIVDKVSMGKIMKSSKNIPNVKVTDINHFSAFDIVKFKKIIFTESSVKELEKRYE